MSIKVQIEGLEELRAAFTNLEREFDEAVADAIEATTLEIRNEVIRRIQSGPASGRVYRRGNITHQASAPGEAPMTDTGRLVGSVYMDIAPQTATVGSRLVYAAYLEHGTRRMAPRPVWEPVAEEQGQLLRQRVIDNLNEVLR